MIIGLSRGKEFLKKTSETLDEANLFANLFIIFLFVILDDNCNFIIHLWGFMTILMILTQKQACSNYHGQLSVFLPLAPDLILHADVILSA